MRVGERRIRPGSDPGEEVDVQEMRLCPCEHCDMAVHWMFVATFRDRAPAERLVEDHNRSMDR